ncbi:protein ACCUMULATION AND REPLICATION OF CHLOROPLASTS 3 [Cucurbita maxima]|uniref:Protein ACCUMULATION AND REPLICATION OF CHLOROPLASTS 3 n=1 Tax=Cucurbita maxima TaxID=3661 RepID=A0A6J1JRB9_CUCMA|nr:protein ACCUMULATION AND REPLICATION OF CHLOROPLASTS 3 [Cucurbita maxima]
MVPLVTELPVINGFHPLLRSSLCPCSCSSIRSLFFPRRKMFLGLAGYRNSYPFLSTTANSSLSNAAGRANTEKDFWDDYEFVEVIGIGSRKEAVLDFCLESALRISSLRFWQIVKHDSLKVQLLQRFIGKDYNPRMIDVPLSLQSCSKAVILVVSAGYGLDYSAAVDILRTVRSANGFTVTIVLKPFSFEGQRRQDEVKHLVGSLKEHTSFLIDIDTDRLLEKDLVTLDEAVRSANNAVLMAINSISIIKSEMLTKFIDEPQNSVKELGVIDVMEILENLKEGKIGFGAGHNFRTSVLKSIYDCPFLSVHLKDLKGAVLCIVASSSIIDDNDKSTLLKTFREVTAYTGKVILSIIQDLNLEPNFLMTTILIVGSTKQQSSKSSSILSRLAQRFPSVFKLLWKPQEPLEEAEESDMPEDANPSNVRESSDSDMVITQIASEGLDKDFYQDPENLQTTFNYSDLLSSRGTNDSDFEQPEAGIVETDVNSLPFSNAVSRGASFRRDPLHRWNLGPAHQIAQQWARERAADAELASAFDSISIFDLPVGVRTSEELKDKSTPNPEMKYEKKSKASITTSRFSSQASLTDTSLEVIKEFYDTSSAFLRGKSPDLPKKQGLLSARAASMLEAERDSPKKWSPVMELQYRGGVYRGRCQGGLPEGKGRLVLQDGSIYDGMWRYGMRSGQGTVYFNNGDMFQGSWRDDVMHGKGWFYFHTGDRWFANFWKGKAYGEGRFYSKSGDVLFGHFQDGWRHGDFLCINVDGSRYIEVWSEGYLMGRENLESGADTP